MIKFKRGTTAKWREFGIKLAAGQPGYDKTKHKIKIGDGTTPWKDLPYASGLSEEDIILPEYEAKIRAAADSEDKTLFTYGTDTPDNTTVGKVYMQYYETEPEVDYVISCGSSGIWTYQKWKSGLARCWGTITVTSPVQNTFEEKTLYYDSSMKSVSYPFTFVETPKEFSNVISTGGLVWLASRTSNTTKKSGAYTLISPDSQNEANYKINLQVEGFWK